VTILVERLSWLVWETCLGLKEMRKVNLLACYYRCRLGVLRLKRMHVARLKQYRHETKGKSDMPKVGKKEFAYTPKGMAMAKAEAKKTGKKMKYGKKKK
jgi:hypothetical protein